jgi:hypothetical protein
MWMILRQTRKGTGKEKADEEGGRR